MKELTIEEKAKAYDKILVKAKQIYNKENDVLIIHTIEEIFPQLKESEDEKIRKAIIGFLKEEEAKADITSKRSETLCKYIAWLEKQGEQKDSYTKQQLRDMGFAFTLNGDIVTLEKTNEAIKELLAYQKKKWEEEQKPTKVEPKFKIGDWVVPNNGEPRVFMVEERGWPDSIISDPLGNQSVNTFTLDKQYHLWTIQDAKDGDVLNSIRVKATIIFKEWNSDGKHINAYCALQKGILIKQEMLWDRDFELATKEQRDLLFQKMKEAGYKWDADKKELKEIKQLTKFEEAVKDLMNDYRDAIGDNDATIEEIKKHSEYLLSLIQQKPIEWGEKDENIIETLINLVRGYNWQRITCGFVGADKEAVLSWLKFLKDRVRPKQEWSEKDNQYLCGLIGLIEQSKAGLPITLKGKAADNCIDWLKSLRPQNTWKPSDEQMKQLYKYCPDNRPLTQLYQDLKKLMEE